MQGTKIKQLLTANSRQLHVRVWSPLNIKIIFHTIFYEHHNLTSFWLPKTTLYIFEYYTIRMVIIDEKKINTY